MAVPLASTGPATAESERGATLIELAKHRLPQYADHSWVANLRDILFPSLRPYPNCNPPRTENRFQEDWLRGTTYRLPFGESRLSS